MLAPKLEHLIREIRAGHPVLVLQNLQLPQWPKWHYAVVIGIDLEADEVILRSGTTRREVLSLHRFERSWQFGDYWAIVVAPEGETPATAPKYLAAVVPLEQQNAGSLPDRDTRPPRSAGPITPPVLWGWATSRSRPETSGRPIEIQDSGSGMGLLLGIALAVRLTAVSGAFYPPDTP